MGLDTLPSQSNFLLSKMPEGVSAQAVYLQLKERGILVRYFDQDRLRDKLRISIGSESENQRLMAALREILNT
jgi:histidinol-phosphate aminotransferase